jgi:hypothetical protein
MRHCTSEQYDYMFAPPQRGRFTVSELAKFVEIGEPTALSSVEADIAPAASR